MNQKQSNYSELLTNQKGNKREFIPRSARLAIVQDLLSLERH